MVNFKTEKKTMKKIFVFFLSISVSLLCACYDSQEIDKSAYVIALGIDNGTDGYIFTFQISSPLAMGGGGELGGTTDSEKNTRVENIIIGSSSLSEAKSKLNNFLSKKINLSHLKIIIFSENVAKTGLSAHLPFLLREREIRPDTKLAVSSSTAEDFLKSINPALEANTADYYDLVFENGGTFAPEKTLWEFVNEQETFASALPRGNVSELSTSSDFSPDTINRISTSKAEFSGLYLIKDYMLVGDLPPTQSVIYSLLSGKTKNAEFDIPINSAIYSVKLYPIRKPSVKIRNYENTTTIYNASFNAQTNCFSPDLTTDVIKNHLITEAYVLFSILTQSDCDIFNTGNLLKRKCKTINEWENLIRNNPFSKTLFIPQISINQLQTN